MSDSLRTVNDPGDGDAVPAYDSATRTSLAIAAAAAFCTYFCMYAFRKPFTAGTFDGETLFGLDLKVALVVAQVAGYTLSKFIGIKIVSEMPAGRRALGILSLIVAAELGLVLFAILPVGWKPLALFLNGLPLGMVFGLVIAYLEGRRQTEALTAALSASFIVSSGVVKSVGRWLIGEAGLSEYTMPAAAGALFFVPLLVSVWALSRTPPPGAEDRRRRAARNAMTRDDRRQFLAAYWPGLVLMVGVYVTLTIVRTVRDDFAVEIWRDLGVAGEPSVFARSETVVAILVTAACALFIFVRDNRTALAVTLGLMVAGFCVAAAAAAGQGAGALGPFPFMVACGVGLYVPYVAFHTTVFERIIAAAGRPCNIGFLMYLADSSGYLGHTALLLWRSLSRPGETIGADGDALPLFRGMLLATAAASAVALTVATVYFLRVLRRPEEKPEEENASVVTAPASATPQTMAV
ncbi:DUF5690 family protein [Alienimonas chondri]|uniref:MFS transporter n=1 Tax=Alienimonas chondri TaxID=2681879 RepID=A0ABX1VAS4_9PLAN|nr:DUF5690 family protein [Alienimonas chondri]NNJ24121.1 hypothetical protein [Alienimonas chondri]